MTDYELRRLELATKLAATVKDRFAGSNEAAFAYYDRDHDGKLSRLEIRAFLTDAGIGNVFTRTMWINGILDSADGDRDGMLTKEELARAWTP